MEADGDRLGTGEVLGRIEVLLDRVQHDRSGADPAERLQWVTAARRVADRMGALASVLLAEAAAVDASMRATRTPLSTWLGLDQKLSKREAAGALHRATELAARPQLGAAATAGRVGAGQAQAITRVLKGLAPQLDETQQQAAESLLVDLADELDADQLAKSTERVLQAVALQRSDELTETRLQREAEAAQRQRSVRLWRHEGSVRFDGSLPRLEGEAWIALLDAHAESLRRCALGERDPLATSLTPEQRRADALIAMIRQHQITKQAPSSGGDRPRLVVTIDYSKLRDEAAAAGLIGDNPISAGELRRLCCEAGILPAMLGGDSQVLDIGRESRTIPPGMRAALTLRDGGCAFPTCHARAAVCEAHHIIPWWAGGPTALSNLMLLCHHHHALVEPDRYGTRDQWQARLGAAGLPQFRPPARYDPTQPWISHQRFRYRPGAQPAGSADPPTDDPPVDDEPTGGDPAAPVPRRVDRRATPSCELVAYDEQNERAPRSDSPASQCDAAPTRKGTPPSRAGPSTAA